LAFLFPRWIRSLKHLIYENQGINMLGWRKL